MPGPFFCEDAVMSDSWYDRHVLPYVIDLACGIKPVRRQRQKVVPLAQGRVLAQGAPADVLTPALVGRLFDVDPALAAPILAAAEARR